MKNSCSKTLFLCCLALCFSIAGRSSVPEKNIVPFSQLPPAVAFVGCGENFYDPGGPSGYYSDNQQITTIICPHQPGEFVEVTFSSFETEGCCDFLTVYDGSDASAPTLGSFSGINSPNTLTATDPSGCLTFVFTTDASVVASGWEASVTCAVCHLPKALRVENIRNDQADLKWNLVPLGSAVEWEAGLPGFVPGTGQQVASGLETGTEALINGLTGNTAYEAYARRVCPPDGEMSGFAGPVAFRTSPGCGDPFYDLGGPDAGYTPGEVSNTLICPDVPGTYVSVDFQEYNVPGVCETLSAYDGEDLGTAPQTGAWYSGTSPSLVTATNPSGCLIFQFSSNLDCPGEGWEATVACVTCPTPNWFNIYDLTATTVFLEWHTVPQAISFEWEMGPTGFTPGTGAATASGVSTASSTLVEGLESGTEYDAYVRTICSGSDASLWRKIIFSTQPSCGDYFFDPGGATGDYPDNSYAATTICPETPGTFVSINFEEFDLAPGAASLAVYDEGSQVGDFQSSNPPHQFIAANNPSGCLSFLFTSTNSGLPTGSGFKALVSCVTCPNPNGPYVYPAFFPMQIEWSWVSNADSYDWEIVLPGALPGSGAAVAAGNSNTTFASVPGLESNTTYEAYVRTSCGTGGESVFSGPVSFTTPLSCGDSFFDPGGVTGSHPDGQNSYSILCPETPGTYIEVAFDEFDMTTGCAYLEVWNGNVQSNHIGTFSGNTLPPVQFSTDQTGCLTIVSHVESGCEESPGWSAQISCVTCIIPQYLQAGNTTANSADFYWSESQIVGNYEWEVTPVGVLPGTGGAVTSGTGLSTSVQATGLESGTMYHVWVRADCGGGDFSSFAGPLLLMTVPSCGEMFYDVGGPDGNYPHFVDRYYTICPDVPGGFVQVHFSDFQVTYDFLEAWDGENTGGAYLGYWSGDFTAADFTLTANNPSGCITFHHYSNGYSAPGWEASVTCITCPDPSNLTVGELYAGQADISWQGVFAATAYDWEIGLPGFVPGSGQALFSGSTGVLGVTVQGLDAGTTYSVYVRSSCNGTDMSGFVGPVDFTTAPSCGGFFYDPGGPDNGAPLGQFGPTHICPDVPGEFVEMAFEEFDLEPCCAFLQISDNDLFLGNFTGNNPPPVMASNAADGCLNILFNSGYGDLGDNWKASVTCVTCPRPNLLEAQGATANSISFGWNYLAFANGYEWEVGLPGFIPGNGEAVAFGSTVTDLTATAIGLQSGTSYEARVRRSCSDGQWSGYSPPVFITTLLSCGDSFFDFGGPDENYPPYGGGNLVTTICPAQPGQAVVVNFSYYSTNPWEDYLYVYDGPGTSSPLIGTLYGSGGPVSFQSTDPSGCLTFYFAAGSGNSYPGWAATVDCITCAQVTGLIASTVMDGTATLSWAANPSAALYNWEVGPTGFQPGTGAAVASSSTTDNTVQVQGLASSTSYQAYVWADCGTGGIGAFGTPAIFSTPARCGDLFYDSGGPFGSYGNSETYQATICPDFPGQKVSVAFNYFSTDGNGDYLYLYDGPTTSDPFVGAWTGNNVPFAYTSTHPSGCLTYFFVSDGNYVYDGWEAVVTCEGCVQPPNFAATDPTTQGVDLSWEPVPDASSYHWEIGLPGFTPGFGLAKLTGNTASTSIAPLGLESNTGYEAYVRSICGASVTSEWAGPLHFSTSEACGGASFDSGGPNADYGANEDTYTLYCPLTPNDPVSLLFTFFETQSCCDFLEILNGNDPSSPSLGLFSGNALPGPFTSTDDSGCLLLHFTSNAATHRGGWEAQIVCGVLPARSAGGFVGKFEASPNPASESLQVTFEYPLAEQAELSLFDLVGRRVEVKQIEATAGNNVVQFDLSLLPAGTYLLTLEGPFGKAVQRVVKS